MNAYREIPPEERASNPQDTWQAVGDVARRLVEKVTRQRSNAPGDDRHQMKGNGDEQAC